MKTRLLSFLLFLFFSSTAFAQRATYWVRVFNCDDGCRAYVDGRIVADIGFAQDTGWIDISNRLGSGAAKLKVQVINNAGGIAYGIQVRVNTTLVVNQVCGRAGAIGCDNNAVLPAGVAREFSYTILPGADSTSDSALMVVSKDGQGTKIGIDQFAELNRGILAEPDSFRASPGKSSKDLFPTGTRYRLLFGGGEGGSLTVTGKTRTQDDCSGEWGYEPVVVAQTAVRLGGQVRALATNSPSLGQRASARRAPTASERASALALVQSIFRQKGVPALLRNIETTNLTATDLDGDGKFELIGSFSLKRADAVPYILFLVAKPGGLAFEPELILYYGEGSTSGGVHYIDQIDLDGDGIAELIVENNYEYQGEANRVQIYKKQGGRWVVIYERPGSSC
jgi:hypothetical protein